MSQIALYESPIDNKYYTKNQIIREIKQYDKREKNARIAEEKIMEEINNELYIIEYERDALVGMLQDINSGELQPDKYARRRG